ncbi:MAG: ABC transporter ATP-binding protein [Porticoccaceae bacterium]|nr:ABC transporter ATP-binding protein [Porticoccaceae bacterium]
MSIREPLLSITDLCVDYITDDGNARAVNQVNLDIHAGETVGLAGESGCGKSTLAFAIANLHSAPALITAGKIKFQGQDVLTMSEEELRQFRWSQASMVFQSAMNALNPVLTIGDQLVDVVLAHETVTLAEAQKRSEAVLDMVGMHASRMKSYPHQLSGGMRQRVVIAIALILRPKLIIMDEPTTALDVVVEMEIMDQLYDLKEEFGFAILFISHDLGLMGQIADRIGIMYAGKMVELGNAEDVLSRPQHPYTQGLLRSFPTIHGPKERLEGIPGHPLNLLSVPTGCYFQERCSLCEQICVDVMPSIEQYKVPEERQVACHKVGQGDVS